MSKDGVMRLNNDTYEYIKREVIDLFVRYDVQSVPICGFELATQMGIHVVPYSALSKKKRQAAMTISSDGFYCEPGDGQEYIYYNDVCISYERINMTILHEVGHCALGHDGNTDPDIAEAEAGFFAKYAIAPPPLVHKIRPTCAADISRIFLISSEAASNAYAYYRKWLLCGPDDYTSYELVLLGQFEAAG